MRVTDQSTPIWDRPNNPRGHSSSIERALQAHREQVSARNTRTEARLLGAATPVDQFFVNPARSAATSVANSETMENPKMVESPAVSIQPTESPIEEKNQSPMMAMGDLYESLATTPVRNLAPTLVENEAVDDLNDIQSDVVPEGSTVHYYA